MTRLSRRTSSHLIPRRYIRYVYSSVTAQRLRRLRKGLRLSQSEFASLVGVSANTVARWERGEMGMRATATRLIELIAAQSKVGIERKKGS